MLTLQTRIKNAFFLISFSLFITLCHLVIEIGAVSAQTTDGAEIQVQPVQEKEDLSAPTDLAELATISADLNTQPMTFTREHLNNVAPTGSFDVGPTMFKIKANRGDVIKRAIQVTSRNEKPTSYSVRTEDYEGSQDPTKSHILLGDGEGKYGAKNWFKAGINNFDLELGDRIIFEVEIKVPEDADPGEHYASLLIVRQPMTQNLSNGTQVDITSRIGTTFMIDVNGDIEKSGHLENFKVQQNFFKSAKPIVGNIVKKQPFNFEITFRNTGNTHLMPSGTIEVKNIFGQTKKVTDPNAVRKPIETRDTLIVNGFNVLRDSVRNSAKQSRTDTEQIDLNFGIYSATLSLDNGLGKIDEMTTYFWYLPVNMLVICLLILLALAIFSIVIINKKKQKKKVSRKNKESVEDRSDDPVESSKFKNS